MFHLIFFEIQLTQLDQYLKAFVHIFVTMVIIIGLLLYVKQNAPVDEWKYPVDGKRVRGQQAKLGQDPQSSHRSASSDWHG